MLYVFAGGHRMGSHFQTFVVTHGLSQLGTKFAWVDRAAMNTFHLGAIRRGLARCDALPAKSFVAKTHASFPIQIDTLLSARNVRVFLIWRPLRDCLVSDYHFARSNAGHAYKDFDDYFAKRGRRVMLRNRLHEVTWSTRTDDRVRGWQYLDLRDDFARVAGEMLAFAEIDGVDIDRLAEGLQIDKLRAKYRDPEGKFFRKGGAGELSELEPSEATMAQISEIEAMSDAATLGREYLRCDRWQSLLFGSEVEEAGLRKSFQTWLYRSRRIRRLRRRALSSARKSLHRLVSRR